MKDISTENVHRFVRLKEIEIENAKAIGYGKITISPVDEPMKWWGSSFAAIYGANGTGKTTALEAMGLLYTYLSGGPIVRYLPWLLRNGSNEMRLLYTLAYTQSNWSDFEYNIFIELRTGRNYNDHTDIIGETFSVARITGKHKCDAPTTLIKRDGYNVQINDINGIPEDTREEMFSLINQIFVNKNMSAVIFDRKFMSLIQDNSIKPLTFIATFVSTVKSSMGFYGEQFNSLLGYGVVYPNSDMDSIVNDAEMEWMSLEDAYDILSMIKDINRLLPPIMPNITLSLTSFFDKNGDLIEDRERLIECVTYTKKPIEEALISEMASEPKFENKTPLVSIDVIGDDGKTYEIGGLSLGGRKIICLLTLIRNAFKNKGYIAVIDEIDAGIHGVVIRNIIKSFLHYGRGQIICTSHCLEQLEVLQNDNVTFTTTNPNNRFTKIRATGHGIREDYLRAVSLGGEEEELLREISADEIAAAMFSESVPRKDFLI